MKKPFSIGKLACFAGVSVQTLRYYERRGILTPLGRNSSGFRIYDDSAIKRLRLIAWAKGLGFTLEDIKDTLNLQGPGNLTCTRAREKAYEKLALLEDKVRLLRSILDGLQERMDSCKCQCPMEECRVIREIVGG